jgi:hypothetical protein
LFRGQEPLVELVAGGDVHIDQTNSNPLLLAFSLQKEFTLIKLAVAGVCVCVWGDFLVTYKGPIRSYRYAVAMFPLPFKIVLKYHTREKVGGISILVFNTKCSRECRPHFAACGTPDRAVRVSDCPATLLMTGRRHWELS